MLPLWGWDNQRIDERQHPGGRACHIAGGCPDALARQGPHLGFAMCKWRTGRDSNPRYGVTVYTLSRRAPSTTRPPVHEGRT